MKRLLFLCAFAYFSVLPLSAQKTEGPLVFTPQWTAQAQFAGYYVA